MYSSRHVLMRVRNGKILHSCHLMSPVEWEVVQVGVITQETILITT